MSDAASASTPQTPEPEAPVQPTAIVPADALPAANFIDEAGEPKLAMMPAMGFRPMSRDQYDEIMVQVRDIVNSRQFAGATNQAEAMVRAMVAFGYNIDLIAAMRNIHLVEGRVSMSSELMLALVQRTGKYRYVWLESSDTVAKIMLWEVGYKEEACTVTWTIEMAQKAELTSKKNWIKYPDAMLRSRAASAVIKMRAPEVLLQAYTPDELGATVEYTRDGREVIMEVPQQELCRPLPSVSDWSLSDEQKEKLVYFMGVAGWDRAKQDEELVKANISQSEYFSLAHHLRNLLEAQGNWEKANKSFLTPDQNGGQNGAEAPESPAEAENTPDQTAEKEPPEPRPEPAVVTPLPVEQVVPADPDSPVPAGLTPQIFGQLSDSMDYLELSAPRQDELMGRVLALAPNERQAAAVELLEALRLDIRAREHVAEQAEGQQSMFPEPQAHDKEPAPANRPGSASRSGSGRRR